MTTAQQRPQRTGTVTADRRDETYAQVTHLLRRAGFGAARDEILAAAKQGYQATVNLLVDYEQVPDTFTPPPDSILNAGIGMMGLADLNQLTAWWLNQMLTTSRPLQEKMTLFWHGHFATGIQKVRSTLYMYQQNQLFRQNALARFDDILGGVYKDPAMLIWLDGRQNTKFAPNENWGREVMELFTLGHGNYTEDDVHACSRAFTGWRIGLDGQAAFVPRLHDDGMKTLLGQTGTWLPDDAVTILAAHYATGPFLAQKLWRFFASDQPPASAIGKLSRAYYSSDHDMREMVRALFSMPEFTAQQTRTGHIKSPTEFVVTAIGQLGLTDVDTTMLPAVLTNLGQQLFNPSNVGGWPGGPTWINAATMLGRFNFASWLSGDRVASGGGFDPEAILTASGAETMDQLVYFITDALGVSMTQATRGALMRYAGRGSVDNADVETKIRGLIHLVLVSPEFQVS